MRILILGGTKFVGPHVVRQLAAPGQSHEITIFHRGATETELPDGVRHIHGDFASFDMHLDELKRLTPEVVLDMVPFREEDAARVKAFAGMARRVVVISSQDVYRAFGRLWRTEPGPPDPVPLTEDSPLREKLSSAGLEYNKTGTETAIDVRRLMIPPCLAQYCACRLHMARATTATDCFLTSNEWTTGAAFSLGLRNHYFTLSSG